MSLIHNVNINQTINVSAQNSTTAPILAGATWTGVAEDIVNYTGIQTLFKADQNCTVYIDQGSDGITWEITDSWPTYANVGDARSFLSVAPYFRMRIKNTSLLDATSVLLAVGIVPILNILPRKLLEQGGLFTTTNQNVVADPLNSTIIPLNYTDVFTGQAVSTLGIAGIQISMKADQNCTVYVDQSPNGINWDITDSFNYYTTKSFGVTVQAVNSYYRIRIENTSPGQGNMTYMRFQTALCPIVEAVPRTLDEEQNFRICVRDIENVMGHITMAPMGSLKTAETTKLAGATFIGTTVDPNLWIVTPAAAGIATQANGFLTLNTSANANSGVLVNSVRTSRYAAGMPNYFRCNLRAPGVIVDPTVGWTCTRRWGAFDVNNGFFFELYQIHGSNPVLKVVSRNSTSDNVVPNGFFNGILGAEYVLDANVHSYEIWWNNKNVWFFIDGNILHTLTVSVYPLSSILGLKVGFQIQNGGGNTSDLNTLMPISGTINRLGKLETSTIWKYINGALAITILKYGQGRLHKVVINQSSGTSITLYDDLAAVVANTIAIIDPSTTPSTLTYDLDFSNGLSVVTVGAGINCTIVYE
jgi:hypothetical protein